MLHDNRKAGNRTYKALDGGVKYFYIIYLSNYAQNQHSHCVVFFFQFCNW